MEILLQDQDPIVYNLRFIELIDQANQKAFRASFDVVLRLKATNEQLGIRQNEDGSRNKIISFGSSNYLHYDASRLQELLAGTVTFSELQIPESIEDTSIPDIPVQVVNPAYAEGMMEYDFFKLLAEYVPIYGDQGLIALWVNEKIHSPDFSL